MGDVGKSISQFTGGGQVFTNGVGALFSNNALGKLGDFLGTNPGAVDTSGYAPSAAEQEFAARLMNQYKGEGPSVAEEQMKKGLDQSNAGAMALSASQRGVSPALAAKMAVQAQAGNNQAVTQATGIARTQEQLNAANTLGGLFSSERQSAGDASKLTAGMNDKASERRSNMISGAGSTLAKMFMSDGGVVPGERDVTPIHPEVSAFASKLGEMAAQKVLTMGGGGSVPGSANVPGDSLKNDTVPTMLSPGEVVIPRSVVEMGPEAIAHFAAALSKKGA